MSQKRRVIFVVYDGFEVLDLTGPSSVFSGADRMVEGGAYEIRTASVGGGAVTSSTGLVVIAEPLEQLAPTHRDTVLVCGAEGPPIARVISDRRLRDWLCRAARDSERYGSICSGAFLLAAAGLLDGRKAATHWEACALLQKIYPRVRLQPDALYVVDGALWTSAGVTTGIDMALTMVGQDHDARLASRIAKRLVVYAHRPGHQSQFSDTLKAQTQASGAFGDLIAWIGDNLHRQIRVEDLATRAAMSERTFYRKFTRAMGVTPSKYIEAARLEKARQLLEFGTPVKKAAAAAGFQSEGGFRGAFTARYGIAPSMHRTMHRSAAR